MRMRPSRPMSGACPAAASSRARSRSRPRYASFWRRRGCARMAGSPCSGMVRFLPRRIPAASTSGTSTVGRRAPASAMSCLAKGRRWSSPRLATFRRSICPPAPPSSCRFSSPHPTIAASARPSRRAPADTSAGSVPFVLSGTGTPASFVWASGFDGEEQRERDGALRPMPVAVIALDEGGIAAPEADGMLVEEVEAKAGGADGGDDFAEAVGPGVDGGAGGGFGGGRGGREVGTGGAEGEGIVVGGGDLLEGRADGVDVEEVERAARPEVARGDLGPARDVGQPAERAVGGIDEVEALVEEGGQVVEVGADEGGIESGLGREGAGARDGGVGEVYAGDAGAQPCPGEG